MKISVIGDKAEIIDGQDEIINSGGIQYYRVEVEFDSAWDNLTKVATIKKYKEETGKEMAILDNEFYINAKTHGTHLIGIVGYTIENETKTYQISCNLIKKFIGRGSASIVCEESELPTEWELYIKQIEDIVAQATHSQTYIHRQDVASDEWVINHNLDKFPSVSVVDSSGNIVFGDVTYIDDNNIKITFSAEFGGKAYLN